MNFFRTIFLLAAACVITKGDTTASGVYGQAGSFTSNSANNGGVSASSLSSPAGTTLDAAGNSYVADFGNNRVLFFLKGSTTATRVYGQGGSFTSNSNNLGNVKADTLTNPNDVALDSSGTVYIADYANNRILSFLGTSTTATTVYGQGGSFTTGTTNKGGLSADSLNRPSALVFDSSNNLYVADGNNNRVLFYPVGSTTATRVYGQGGSFTTANSLPITALSLSVPTSLALDSDGNLYVSDSLNSRVLFYSNGVTTASRVYGQVSFTVGDSTNPGGVSASTLSRCRGITLDSSSNLYVADAGNNRVLYYLNGSTAATKVYGQSDSLTSNTANNGGVTAKSLQAPSAVRIDSTGKLFITDQLNNRMLTYDSLATTTGGGTTPPAASTTCFHESTIITYKGKDYKLQQLIDGEEKECHVPHTVKTKGLIFELECQTSQRLQQLTSRKVTLRLTDDHLVMTARGMVPASALTFQDDLYGDLKNGARCNIRSKFLEENQVYFGLNCYQSLILANGIKTSTFGNYHLFPSIWMEVVGRLAGIKQASRWGDLMATKLLHWGLL